LDGEPGADPTQAFPDDVFFIERKVQETKGAIEFEIGTPIDVEDVSLPRRQFLANLCAWGYRSSECGFTSATAIAAQDDTPPGITLNPRGAWSAGATYEIGDVAYLTTSRGLAFYWVHSVGGGSDISGEGASPTNAAFWKKDECSKRIKGCEMRFGADPNGLPFGGFPAADRQRG
jgi:phage-related protein